MSSFFLFRDKILFRDILFRLGRRIVEVEIQTIENRGMILRAYYFKIFLVE